MNIKEFRKQAKELALSFGFTKQQISVVSDSWLLVRIISSNFDKFKALKAALEKLAGYEDNSDAMTDYFNYRVAVTRNNGGSYGGLLITNSRP